MTSLTVVLLMISLQTVMSFNLWDLETPIKKCSVPNKFEGQFKVTVKMGPKQILLASGTGTIHKDDTVGKVAVLEKVTAKGHTFEVDTYIGNNTTYVAKPVVKQCQKLPTGTPIIPGKVPKGLTLHVKRGVLHGIHVQIWEFGSKPGVAYETITMYLTEAKCMPMKVEMKVIGSGQTIHMVEDLFDMKEGIKDPSIFNLPKYCVKWNFYGESVLLSTNLAIQHAIKRHEMHSWILF